MDGRHDVCYDTKEGDLGGKAPQKKMYKKRNNCRVCGINRILNAITIFLFDQTRFNRVKRQPHVILAAKLGSITWTHHIFENKCQACRCVDYVMQRHNIGMSKCLQQRCFSNRRKWCAFVGIQRYFFKGNKLTRVPAESKQQ